MAQVHSYQLHDFLRFFFCVRTGIDVPAGMFVLAVIICGMHYRMTLKASSELCVGKVLSKSFPRNCYLLIIISTVTYFLQKIKKYQSSFEETNSLETLYEILFSDPSKRNS